MLVKIVLVGDQAVGKTSIYQRLEQNTFDLLHIPTISGTFARLAIPVSGHFTDVGLWDTAGQERFRSMIPLYFQRASIVVIVFAVNDRSSYDNIDGWYKLAKEHAPLTAHFFLVGNKCELAEREVEFEDAHEKAADLNVDVYIEVSAASSQGCDDLMGAFSWYLESQEKAMWEAKFQESNDITGSECENEVRKEDGQRRKCC
jgi:small GTP-binding protein